jgi:hypothetical protein
MSYPYAVNADNENEPADGRNAGMSAPELRALKAKVNKIFQGGEGALFTFVTDPVDIEVGARSEVDHTLDNPLNIILYLTCVEAELGYSTGDLLTAPYVRDGGNYHGALAMHDASKVRILQQSLPTIPDRTGSGVAEITAANWKYIAAVSGSPNPA